MHKNKKIFLKHLFIIFIDFAKQSFYNVKCKHFCFLTPFLF